MDKETRLKIIGEFCKQKRLQNNLLQRELGELCGYRPETVSAFEQGLNNNLIIFLQYLKMMDSFDVEFLLLNMDGK